MNNIDDDPVLERVTAPTCAVAGCTGRATEGRVCMYHQYAPGGPVPTPLAVVRPIRRTAPAPPRAPGPRVHVDDWRYPGRGWARCGAGGANNDVHITTVKDAVTCLLCRKAIDETNNSQGEPEVNHDGHTQAIDDAPATDGLVACPDCAKRCKPGGLGIHRAKAHGTPGKGPARYVPVAEREAPPEAEADMPDLVAAYEAVAEHFDAEEATDVDGIPGVALTFDQDELDVLDACAFLEGVDRYELVAGLITEWITLHADDGDVKLCLAARRGHRDEAA